MCQWHRTDLLLKEVAQPQRGEAGKHLRGEEVIADESLIRHKAIMHFPSWRLVKHKPVVQTKFDLRVLACGTRQRLSKDCSSLGLGA